MTTKTDLELTKKDKKKFMGKKRNILNQVFFKNYYYYFKFQKKPVYFTNIPTPNLFSIEDKNEESGLLRED